MTLIRQDTIEALHRIIQDTKVAQQDLLGALERISALPWPHHDEVVSDLVAMLEPTLCKLSVYFTRIALRAEKALPSPDLEAQTDEIAAEFMAAQERDGEDPEDS